MNITIRSQCIANKTTMLATAMLATAIGRFRPLTSFPEKLVSLQDKR
jgi:hypothetical protein